jgi:thiaminase/transcriptional activator TenA
MSVSQRLRLLGAAAWQAAVGHPMVREIGDGSLPHAKFRRYFEQNIWYLEDYARAIAMVTSKAPDTEALVVLSEMTAQIITVELPANRDFLLRLGGGPAGPRHTAMAPTTYAYTSHLLATCAYGDCASGLTALLPCQWSYGEIGSALVAAKPADPIYADWVSLFGDPAYSALVSSTTALLDRLAGDADHELGRLRGPFDASTRYEVAFWDMAYGPSMAAP